jgi:hypothetical protein
MVAGARDAAAGPARDRYQVLSDRTEIVSLLLGATPAQSPCSRSWIGATKRKLILRGYCVCVIDPEGDYSSLEALPGVTVLGREDAPPTPRELLRALRYPDRSVVIDLCRLEHDQKLHYVRSVLPALNVRRARSLLCRTRRSQARLVRWR